MHLYKKSLCLTVIFFTAIALQPAFCVELLNDPGFEESDPNQAVSGWRRNSDGDIIISGEGAHSGQRLLQLKVSEGKQEAAVYQTLRGIDLSRSYTLSVWVKGQGKLTLCVYQYGVENVGGKFNQTDLAQLKMGDQKIVYLRTLTKQFPLTADWARYEFTFKPDAKATSIAAAIHVQGGTGAIDDASLVVEGEKADEIALPLRFTEFQGCSFDNGILRPVLSATQAANAPGIIMEAEQAVGLMFYSPGGIHADETASGKQYVDFCNGITFDFAINTPGVYQAWYRLNVPFVSSWAHSEQMDSKPQANEDAGQKDSPSPNTWSWRPGPKYTLTAGKHTWKFDNWHGGIRLDQVALLPEGTPPPADGAVMTPSPIVTPDKCVAMTDAINPYALQAWRRLAFAKQPLDGTLRMAFSSDNGKTWQGLNADGDLSSLPISSSAGLRFRFDLQSDPNQTGRIPVSIVNPKLVYVPGKLPDFLLDGKKVSCRVRGLSASLTDLKQKERNIGYCLSGNQGQPLFTVTFRKLQPPYGLEELSSLDGQLIKAGISSEKKNAQRLDFSYSFVGGSLLVNGWLQVDDTELIRGQINLDYSGNDEVIAVAYPQLSNLAIANVASNDTLVIPFVQGQRIEHPAAQSFAYPRYWTWPGSLSMGYVDLYDRQAKAGLYLSSYDPTFTTTQFSFQGSGDGAVLGMGIRKWIRLRKGQKYESPEVVIGLHPGDWHWAADRYREWSETWFQKGNTPRWFQESDGYVQGGPFWNGPFDQSLLGSAELCPGFGSGLVATWGQMVTINGACGVYAYPSPWYGGVNNLRWTHRKMHELGIHANYYIQGHLYNPTYNRENSHIGNTPKKYVPEADWNLLPDKQFYSRVRLIEPEGSSSAPDMPAEVFCDSGKREWNQFLIDWTLRFIKDYGADGMYYDGFAIGSAWPSINYDDEQSTTGDWGRGQLRVIRTCKEEGRKINPDVVFGIEGCSDVYQQFGDWGLMGNLNAMEMFRYTFPDLISIGGGANGDVTKLVEQVFMNAYRLDDYLHQQDTNPQFVNNKYYAFLRPWAGRVAMIRQIVNPFLLRARFMDTVGVMRTDAGVDARLMIRNDKMNRGALVLLHNTGEKPGLKVDVATEPWGPVKAAWRVTYQGIQPFQGERVKDGYRIEIPADKYSAALLINSSEPLVDKRLLPLGIAAGTSVKGTATVINLNPKPMKVSLQVTGPKGFGGNATDIEAKPGQVVPVDIAYQAPGDATINRRVDLLLKVDYAKSATDWLLPACVIGPLDARLCRSGEQEITLTLSNRTPNAISGNYQLTWETLKGLALNPDKGDFAVPANAKVEIKTKSDLRNLQAYDNVIAKLTFTGGNEEAYACVGPYVMNADFELSNFGLSLPLADGGMEYDRLIDLSSGQITADKYPHIVYEGAYRGKGCLKVPKGVPAHITWNAWLVPNKHYKIRIAIKRTTPEGSGFSMSAAGGICNSPWLGNTKTPKLNEWEVFEGDFKTSTPSRHWQASFETSNTGDVYYDALEIEEIP